MLQLYCLEGGGTVSKGIILDMIKALIFDFDGLILDTETPDLQSWMEIYSEYGVSFPASSWMTAVGGSRDLFDPCKHLESQLNQPIAMDEILAERRRRDNELLRAQHPLPGVEKCIDDASTRGLMLGVASSASRGWVIPHLSRIGLSPHFHCIKCGDDVSHVKPAPELYQAVLLELGVLASEAIAFEDSPNGVAAAGQAGIYCVAVPNAVTSQLSLDEADLRIESLADLSLDDLLQCVHRGAGNRKR
jgi:HAD superfamily hydrolase (TIGR01509 family)|tara:strand:+ start:717 stop:1457 length:741 start_codon:yes stop_codon:yes gene_type:complete